LFIPYLAALPPGYPLKGLATISDAWIDT